jgi:hypothetical protein
MISDTAIVIVIIIAIIMLVWQIANNALLLSAVSNGDSSGFVDAVRGLAGLDLGMYCVSLGALLIGTGIYGYRVYKRSPRAQAFTHTAKADLNNVFDATERTLGIKRVPSMHDLNPNATDGSPASTPLSTNVNEQQLGTPGEPSSP